MAVIETEVGGRLVRTYWRCETASLFYPGGGYKLGGSLTTGSVTKAEVSEVKTSANHCVTQWTLVSTDPHLRKALLNELSDIYLVSYSLLQPVWQGPSFPFPDPPGTPNKPREPI